MYRCYCFKNWFMSEQCRIPGDKVTQFPLECALDQVCRRGGGGAWAVVLGRVGPGVWIREGRHT